MLVQPIYSYNKINRTTYPNTFKGTKEEIISEGFKEFVSEGLPIYKVGRTLEKVEKGDAKGAIKQAVGAVDNIVCQPVKQTVATAVAAKGAVI